MNLTFANGREKPDNVAGEQWKYLEIRLVDERECSLNQVGHWVRVFLKPGLDKKTEETNQDLLQELQVSEIDRNWITFSRVHATKSLGRSDIDSFDDYSGFR